MVGFTVAQRWSHPVSISTGTDKQRRQIHTRDDEPSEPLSPATSQVSLETLRARTAQVHRYETSGAGRSTRHTVDWWLPGARVLRGNGEGLLMGVESLLGNEDVLKLQ